MMEKHKNKTETETHIMHKDKLNNAYRAAYENEANSPRN